jgi:hypothetical protein
VPEAPVWRLSKGARAVTYRTEYRGSESADDLSRGDTMELAVFGAGVLLVLLTAAAGLVAGWRLLTLIIGAG